MNILHILGILGGLRWMTNAVRRSRLARQESKAARKQQIKAVVETIDDIKIGDRVEIDGKFYKVKSTKEVFDRHGQTKSVKFKR